MKKKMMAAMISLAMAFTCLPSFAFAAESETPDVEEQVAEEEQAEDEAVPEASEDQAPAEASETAEEVTKDAEESEAVENDSQETAEKGFALMATTKASNTTRQSAKTVSLAKGTKISGTVNRDNNSYWYKFTLGSTSYVKLSFSDPDDACHAKLYKSDSDWDIESIDSNVNSERYLQKGTYYLEVGSYSYSNGKYTIAVLENKTISDIAEPNDTILTAKKLDANKKYNGVIAKTGMNGNGRDVDYAYINAPSSGKYKIILTAKKGIKGDGFVKMNACDEHGNDRKVFDDDNWYTSNISANVGFKTGIIAKLPKGRTYFEIWGDNWDEVEYSIEIVKLPTEKVTGVKVAKKAKKSLTIKCKNVSYKTGYQVMYKKNKGKWSKGSKFSGNTFTIKKLKKRTKYQVKVRTYKVVKGKTYYGPWSKTISAKTK